MSLRLLKIQLEKAQAKGLSRRVIERLKRKILLVEGRLRAISALRGSKGPAGGS